MEQNEIVNRINLSIFSVTTLNAEAMENPSVSKLAGISNWAIA
jgi:hypothetical protein